MMSDDQNNLITALPTALPEVFVDTALHYSAVSIGQALELLDRIQMLAPRPAGLNDDVLAQSRHILEDSLPPEALADLKKEPIPPLPEPGLLPPDDMRLDEEVEEEEKP